MIRDARITSLSPRSLVALIVVGTRLPVLLAGLLAVCVVGTTPPPVSAAVWRISPHEIADMFARWDTFFYNSIALGGYHWNPAVFAQQNVVFFPLYPLLMRWDGRLLGGHPLVAGLLISLLAFSAALVLLYRLAAIEVDESHAWRVVLLLAVFPYALFFSAVYTESLFLLLTVGAFYSMRRRRLGWVGVCGLLAGLTRPNGFWLAVPLACLALWPDDAAACTDDGPGNPADLRLALLVSMAPLVGTALFSEYLHLHVGDALAWVHGQAAWGTPLLGRPEAPDLSQLPSTLAERWTETVSYGGNVAAFLLALVAVRPVMRRFGLAYGLWIVVNILPPVADHLFMSLGRFTSVLFPVFFWLAVRIPREQIWPVAALFSAGQLLLAVWFFLWLGVY